MKWKKLSIGLVLWPCVALSAPADSVRACVRQSTDKWGWWRKRGRGIKQMVRNFSRFDTTYIEPNRYVWTLMGQNTNFFQRISMSSHLEDGKTQTLSFAPRPSFKVGPYVGWNWIFLGYGVDVSRPQSAGKATEFSLSLYSNKVGIDMVYLRNKGNFVMRRTAGFENIDRHAFNGQDFSGLSANSLIVNAYYVLNHQHFSYPAAYNQSTRQKISTGSMLLGARYNKQSMFFNYLKLPDELLLPKEEGTDSSLAKDFKFQIFSTQDFSINFGYAYNWVLSKNWLLAGSITPSLGYRREKSNREKDHSMVRRAMNYVAMDLQGRAGVVWNNGKVFAGASYISMLCGYKRKHLVISNSINYINFYAGIYLGKK